MSEHTSSATTQLVVPVRELTARVPGAHITLLDPFLPVDEIDEGVIAELRELFAELVPFAYVLGDQARFPNGAAYLPPQPVNVFRRITHSLRRAFPETIGPSTSIDTVIPHLLLTDEAEVPTPLEVHAREAVLLAGESTVLATFRFGTTAA